MTQGRTQRWNIDPAHSSIEFAVRHMGIVTVHGRFGQFSGIVELDEDGALRGVDVTIDAASITTGVEQRDAHLRSKDFFDVATYPTLTFYATAVLGGGGGDGSYEVQGDLTLLGQTRPVTLAAEVAPPVTDPWGKQRVGSATGKLDRRRWGLTWNQALEAGGLLVSDEVRFTLDVQAVAPAETAATAASVGAQGR
jgi:polyisoprenoid-binding protein YceI